MLSGLWVIHWAMLLPPLIVPLSGPTRLLTGCFTHWCLDTHCRPDTRETGPASLATAAAHSADPHRLPHLDCLAVHRFALWKRHQKLPGRKLHGRSDGPQGFPRFHHDTHPGYKLLASTNFCSSSGVQGKSNSYRVRVTVGVPPASLVAAAAVSSVATSSPSVVVNTAAATVTPPARLICLAQCLASSLLVERIRK